MADDRKIPATMSTQHPDNANLPEWCNGTLIEGEMEIYEATPGATHVAPDWRIMLEAAEKAGAGTQQYELIEVNFGFPPKDPFSSFKRRQEKNLI